MIPRNRRPLKMTMTKFPAPSDNEFEGMRADLFSVLDWIARVQPVGVFELNRLSLQRVCINVQLRDRPLKVLPVYEHVLLLGKQVGHVVEDEEHALVLVCPHQDVRLLELLSLQRDCWLLIQEGPIDDWGKNANGETHCDPVPLLVHLAPIRLNYMFFNPLIAIRGTTPS